jgi:hypothetical protein
VETSKMVFSTDPTRRNFLFNTTITVGAAVPATGSNQVIAAIFSMAQMANMGDTNIYGVVPSQLYVPLSLQDLAEAREELARIKPDL